MEAFSTFLRESGLWTLFYVLLVAGSHVLGVCLAKEYKNFDLGDDFWKLLVYSALCLVRRLFLTLASDCGSSWKNFSIFHVKVDTDSIVEMTSGETLRNAWFFASVHVGMWLNFSFFLREDGLGHFISVFSAQLGPSVAHAHA